MEEEVAPFSDSDPEYTIYLSPEAWASLQEYLNNPPPPTEFLKEIMRRARERREKSG